MRKSFEKKVFVIFDASPQAAGYLPESNKGLYGRDWGGDDCYEIQHAMPLHIRLSSILGNDLLDLLARFEQTFRIAEITILDARQYSSRYR